MEHGHFGGFIPIQHCYPEDYEKYEVSNEYWKDGYLPVQFFRIRFRKKTGMVLYPHACNLVVFRLIPGEPMKVYLIGRVTETMCMMYQPGALYLILRFPPQYVFTEYKGITNQVIEVQEKFPAAKEYMESLTEYTLENLSFDRLMKYVSAAKLGFGENKLIDEFVFGSLYNEENQMIEEIIENMSYSPRYVRSVIKSLTGITAKRLYDILRLQNIMEAQLSEDQDSLSCVYDFGFYDQAHLNKNIRKLTGLSYSDFKNILREKNR